MDEENTERAIFTLENRIAILEGKLASHRHHRDPTWDLWLRNVDRRGRAIYTDHFRSGVIPAGFAWIADGTFNGVPAALDYSYSDTYFAIASDATPHFLADAITVYEGAHFAARLSTGVTTEIGIRIDDGTDNNYAEIILDPNNLGAYNADFRFRAGGGAVTDNAGPLYSCTEFVIVNLYWLAATSTILGYTIGEPNTLININGWSTGVVGWTASRVGIKVQVNDGNYAYCDWFYSTLS